MLSYLVTASFLLGVAAVATVQVGVLVRDVLFYRVVKWDFTLDSGNNMLFLDNVKMTSAFRSVPIGVARLQLGVFFVALDIIIFVVIIRSLV
jgi:hypothetical protein